MFTHLHVTALRNVQKTPKIESDSRQKQKLGHLLQIFKIWGKKVITNYKVNCILHVIYPEHFALHCLCTTGKFFGQRDMIFSIMPARFSVSRKLFGPQIVTVRFSFGNHAAFG